MPHFLSYRKVLRTSLYDKNAPLRMRTRANGKMSAMLTALGARMCRRHILFYGIKNKFTKKIKKY